MKQILWLILFSVLLTRQASGQYRNFYFTAASERYFSDRDYDSLFSTTTRQLFLDNGVPESLFEKHYPSIRHLVYTYSQKEITRRFTQTERSAAYLKNALPQTQAGSNNTNLYKKSFEESVRFAFSVSVLLKNYLNFDFGDRITAFHSTVKILPDGKLRVEETIRVNNGNGRFNPLYQNDLPAQSEQVNNEIKRGIVRSFPLYYVNKFRLFQNTTFELKQVLKNGQAEPYHTKKEANGMVVYVGRESVYLNPGRYTYSIVYETQYQLKNLKDYDELYWNVTGNGWSFKIDTATCTVLLPEGAAMLSAKCYTGAQGSAAEECQLLTNTGNTPAVVQFKSTKPFRPYEGLTIAVSWPKGHVTARSGWGKFKHIIWNNKAVFFLPFAALFSALFCFFFWWRYGRDPEKGTIYPQFQPPSGYSPAALGYIYHQEYNGNLTAATIVDAAVRNRIHIDVEKEGKIFKNTVYKIRKPIRPSIQKDSYYEDFQGDIDDLIDSTIKKGKYNSDLADLDKTIKKHCEDKYKNKDGAWKSSYRGFFTLNSSYTAIPLLVCIGIGIWALISGLFPALMAKNFWQIAYFVAGIWICVYVLRLFSRLLKAYSPAGRKLMDQIEGFRMFLITADEQRFDTMNPPEKTLALYEKYLPFAIALGAAIEWGEKFKTVLETAVITDSAVSSFSSSLYRDSDNFGSSFSSSFSGAIASASTPPSSSSGGGASFGGGSSGGGGGGGGGGGW